MSYALGIDLGTTYTAAAVGRRDHITTFELANRGVTMPSLVYLAPDGTVLFGDAAERHAVAEADRVAREVKRRFGDPVPVLLGGVPYSAEAITSMLARHVLQTVTEREGGPPRAVTVTYPANWGAYRHDLFTNALGVAGLLDAATLTEPEAAARWHAQRDAVPVGDVVVVYDLGGGTFDAAALRKVADGFEVLGEAKGIEHLGGADIDAALTKLVDEALDGALSALDAANPRSVQTMARLRPDIVAAKEALSVELATTVPVALGDRWEEVRVTRAELEARIEPLIASTVDVVRGVLSGAGVSPAGVGRLLLVGGSSRIPLVARVLEAELGLTASLEDHPKHVVALGAALEAASRGGLAPRSPASHSTADTGLAQTTPDTATGVETGSETDTGLDTGTGSETDTGLDTGTGSETDTGPQTDTGSATDTGSETGSTARDSSASDETDPGVPPLGRARSTLEQSAATAVHTAASGVAPVPTPNRFADQPARSGGAPPAIGPVTAGAGQRTGWQLVVVSGPEGGTILSLGGNPLVVGREPGPGGMALADRHASRTHARIEPQGEVVRVTDAGSLNGTFIDGVAEAGATITSGQFVRFGSTLTTFINCLGPQAAVPAATEVAPWARRLPSGKGAGGQAGDEPGDEVIVLPLPANGGGAGRGFLRRQRDDVAAYAAQLDQLAPTLDDYQRAAALARRAQLPCAAVALVTGMRPRLPADAAFGHVTVGYAAQPATLGVLVPDDLPHRFRPVAETVAAARANDGDAPLVIDLSAEPWIDVAGPDEAVSPAVAQLIGQLALLHEPADVAIAVAMDRVMERWAWLAQLPHTVGQDGETLLAAPEELASRLGRERLRRFVVVVTRAATPGAEGVLRYCRGAGLTAVRFGGAELVTPPGSARLEIDGATNFGRYTPPEGRGEAIEDVIVASLSPAAAAGLGELFAGPLSQP